MGLRRRCDRATNCAKTAAKKSAAHSDSRCGRARPDGNIGRHLEALALLLPIGRCVWSWLTYRVGLATVVTGRTETNDTNLRRNADDTT
jgi:hypothetical protein